MTCRILSLPLLVVLLCAGLLPSSCAFAIGGGRAKAPNLNILWRNADVLGRVLAHRRISSATTSLRAASLEEAQRIVQAVTRGSGQPFIK